MVPRPPGPRPLGPRPLGPRLGPRLGPPPQLRGVASRHAKLVARWMHEQFSWRQFLMGWMVLLIASKVVLLALTFPYFTLTSLVSLQIFHGVWTIAFFCLTVLDTRARLLPNASCLLAGYLPATTVLHILLIPSDYPLPYIITDASTTLLAILTMFALLRMECSLILAEAEELWQQPNTPASEAGTNSTGLSSGANSPQVHRQVLPPVSRTISSPQYQQHPRYTWGLLAPLERPVELVPASLAGVLGCCRSSGKSRKHGG